MQESALEQIDQAIAKVQQRITPVASESLPLDQAPGRILARPLHADRDSPAMDVSAMDGYAIRLEDLGQASLPVFATCMAGDPPEQLLPGQAVRIFTGAVVPAGTDAVVKREDTEESPQAVTINLTKHEVATGQNIRRQGENLKAGQEVLAAGKQLDTAAMAAVATFAPAQVEVRRRVRMAVLNTGDELREPGAPAEPWQIRDSNGLMLDAWLRTLPWVEMVGRVKISDRLDAIQSALSDWLPQADCVLLTGGVSMGDTDFVPEAIKRLGGETVFHRLPIRPGKPVLGAVYDNKPILGLPGNPVSVAVTARILGLPILSHLAGGHAPPPLPRLTLRNPEERTLPLVWYPLVELDADGQASLVVSRGSGDLVSMARSHGFIQIPPGCTGCGPWAFYRW